MKFWKALAEQTMKGGKIKRTHHFLSSTDEKMLRSSSLVDLDDINADDWELYEAPVNTYIFSKAVEMMKQGKKMTRPSWMEGSYAQFNEYNYAVKHGDPRNWSFEDFTANDWILVEDK